MVPLAGEGAGSDVVDPFLRRMKQNVSRRRPGQAREPDVPAQERSQTVVPEESQRARGDFVSRNQRGKPKRAGRISLYMHTSIKCSSKNNQGSRRLHGASQSSGKISFLFYFKIFG